MKITTPVLESLGFIYDETDKEWSLSSHGMTFYTRPALGYESTWEFAHHGSSVWHHATHVEEMIGFAFQDGCTVGAEGVRQEIREVLGLKE